MRVQQPAASWLTARVRAVLLVAALALGWAAIYADRTLLYPLLPLIGSEFHLTGTQQGAIASTYFLTYLALQIPSGILGDRFGLKRVLIPMYLIAGVGLLAVGLLSFHYGLLLAFIALHGFGGGAYYSCSYGLTVGSVPQERRGLSSAVLTSGAGLGVALGLSIAGVLYGVSGSWRLPFTLMGMVTLLLVPVFWALLKGSTQVPQPLGGFRRALGSWRFLAINLAFFFVLYAHWVVLTWGPSFLFREKGVSLNQAGLFTAVVAFPMMLGALLWGRLSDQVSKKRVVLVVVPLSALAILGVASFQGVGLLLSGLAFYGFTGALSLNPLFVAWTGSHALASGKVGLGTAIGVLNTFAMGSSLVAPVVSGWVLDVTGSLRWAFYLAALLSLVGMAFALAARER
ncbi:MAG: MFS transporter [Chloroflexi bacterium]|nr:MFS transporter [Chloroflexota bacterium]